jgi:hypothetical protein
MHVEYWLAYAEWGHTWESSGDCLFLYVSNTWICFVTRRVPVLTCVLCAQVLLKIVEQPDAHAEPRRQALYTLLYITKFSDDLRYGRHIVCEPPKSAQKPVATSVCCSEFASRIIHPILNLLIQQEVTYNLCTCFKSAHEECHKILLELPALVTIADGYFTTGCFAQCCADKFELHVVPIGPRLCKY